MSSVVYREVEVKSALNAVKGMPFDWSLNPWSGCAHKCTYCFARAYHARYREKNVGTDFDSNVEVRVNIADVLRKELRRGVRVLSRSGPRPIRISRSRASTD